MAFEPTTLRQLAQVLKSYDETGIATDSRPPLQVVTDARAAAVVVCSPLQRSLESASRLFEGSTCTKFRQVKVDEAFREVDLPAPPGVGWRLTLYPMLWVMVLRILWLLRLHGGSVESPRGVWRRAHEAARRLVPLAQIHGHVVLVGHSLLNYLIAWVLVRQGWQGKPCFQGYWESISFNKVT